MIIGLVGKPSAGKSTFFRAATLMEVDIANYPFTTIRPNVGAGFVRVKCVHEELGKKECNPREGKCEKGIRFVPVELHDVAGLVPGAHKGVGMGNQFLDDLRQAHALIHVVDFSGATNSEGEPVTAGSHDPAEDIKFLEDELDFWYLGIIKRAWDEIKKKARSFDDVHKMLFKRLSGLRVTQEMVKRAKYPSGNYKDWTEEQLLQVAREFRKKTKPIIVAANKLDTVTGVENFKRLSKEGIIATSAESELALRKAADEGVIEYIPGDSEFTIKNANEKQRRALEFIKSNVLDKFGSTGVQKCLDEAVFSLLEYIAVFPGSSKGLTDSHGRVLPDCFLMPKGTTTLDFAFSLHTDFGNNFVKAIDVKTNRLLGKEHKLSHRDIIEIVSAK